MFGLQLVQRLRAYIELERQKANQLIGQITPDTPTDVADFVRLTAANTLTTLSEIEHILNAHGID